MKIGILGSRKLSCKILNWLVSNNANIIGVVTPPFKGWWNDNLKQLSKAHNVKTYDTIEEILEQKPDILFSINYWKTINKKHINMVKEGIINIHHSYMLKYRGRYSTSWSIINARKTNNWVHGTTLHYITSKLDEGPIISSYKCDITDVDTAESLFIKVEDLAFKMFKDNFDKIINKKSLNLLEPDSDFYFYDRDSNKNLEVKYGLPIEEVYDFVRAWTFKDRPKPYFLLNNKKIILSLENEE
tara:strand:+ start:1143 stop:1871 length:729 start_codon:yes stop_codon:yes gene_type:complete